ncbi:hypothetical protein ACQKOF_11810 [Lysinibacillus sp. NPDC093190]|uniref:hypothetical protein n=1 Tax=Lysinibacillus sp. NPDC093190 TaxID=3390575 RepID=UPI003D0805C5
MYTQQDPIGLARNNPTLYGYVGDVNKLKNNENGTFHGFPIDGTAESITSDKVGKSKTGCGGR